jgi:uncharacterized protein YkwD
MSIWLNTAIHGEEYNQRYRGNSMKSKTLFIFLALLLFLLGSACQSIDLFLEENQSTIQPTPDRPFNPLQATLSAPQDRKLSDSPRSTDGGAPSLVRPTLSGELDAAISSTTEALLSAINVRRALEGWPPLARQAALAEIATNRAFDMSAHAYLSHEDPESAEILVEDMLISMGYHGQVAELVYAANEPLDRLGEIAIDEWFDDADTRSVLLSPVFRFIGIGVMGDGATWVVVQILAEHGP